MADFQTWHRSCPEQCTHQLWFKSVELRWSYWSETPKMVKNEQCRWPLTLKARSHMADFQSWPRSCPEQCTHQIWFKSVELCWSYWSETPPKWRKMNNVGDLWPWRQGCTWLIFELGLEVVQSNTHTTFGLNQLNFVEVIGRKPPKWWKMNNVGDLWLLKARSHMADFRTWPRSCPEQCTHQLWFKSVEHCWSYWSETKSVTDGRTERRIHSPTAFFKKAVDKKGYIHKIATILFFSFFFTSFSKCHWNLKLQYICNGTWGGLGIDTSMGRDLGSWRSE